ncbi:MAG: site-specific integrase [Planctomycetota bacterium]
MLDATDKVMGETVADSWKLFMKALWASGLRVSGASTLRWDRKPGCVSVRLDRQKSLLAFDADSQKSGKVELVPLAPEAVTLLEPHERDRGYVFNLIGTNGDPLLRRPYLASKYIGRIGKRAGVVVDAEAAKFATAHDLRRAFGLRWSRRVMPAVLKELMRHASIETTMTYYISQNAQATASELWQLSGNILGNSSRPPGDSTEAAQEKTLHE